MYFDKLYVIDLEHMLTGEKAKELAPTGLLTDLEFLLKPSELLDGIDWRQEDADVSAAILCHIEGADAREKRLRDA